MVNIIGPKLELEGQTGIEEAGVERRLSLEAFIFSSFSQ